MDAVRCTCNANVSNKYDLFLQLKKETKLSVNEIFEILNITKTCCKLKFITVAKFTDYLN